MYTRLTPLALLVLALVGFATAQEKAPGSAEKLILGKWETIDPDNKQHKITLEFTDKNNVKIGIPTVTIECKYKVLDNENLELIMTLDGTTHVEKIKIKVDEKELIFTGKDARPTKFTRVKSG